MKNRMLAVGLILTIVSAVFACGCVEESEVRYVDERGSESRYVEEPESRQVEERESELRYTEEPKGSISITSDPSGASVYLDGTHKGTTPISLDNVDSGSHTIELTKSGYESKTLAVSLSAGGAENIRESLEPLTGSISISSDPSGANIYLGGIYKGTTPTTISGVLPGSHTIILEKDGYEDLSESVSVAADVTTPLTANLILKLIPCRVIVPNIALTNYRWPTPFVDYGGIVYSATFEINNPNQIPVYLDRIDYTIYMQDVSVSVGTYSESVSIPARGRKTIERQGEIVIPLLPDMQVVGDAFVNGKVDIRLKGTVYYKDTEHGQLPPYIFDREVVDAQVPPII